MRPAHGTLRALRTAYLAVACTGLAWGGHNIWADVPASLGGLALATAFLFPVLWHFTRMMRGFGDIFAVMACAQVVLHLIFLTSAAPVSGSFGAEHAGHADHGLMAHTMGLAPGMLFAHLWAALLASALLTHGETAVWALAGLLSRALPKLLRVPDLTFNVPTRVLSAPLLTAPSPITPTSHGPRGPPGSPSHHF